MDFFREKEMAEDALSDLEDDDCMFLWDLADAHRASVLIFGIY